MNKTIGFIGAGNMGGAIIGGIIKNNLIASDNIFVYDKNKISADKISRDFKVNVLTDVKDISNSDIIILAVKPDVIYSVIDNIKKYITNDKIIVSIAAGQSIKKLSDAFGNDTYKIVRVMPNTPALVGEGMSAISLNQEMQKPENKETVSDILRIFESFGKAEIIPEKLMDAVTGVSGSSPAYVFMFIEAMADSAVLSGMPRKQAYTFAAQAVLGSAKMVLEQDKHPGELKDMVCSPGGTTIEAVKVLEDKNFRGAIIDAIDACVKKSKSL